MDAELLFQDKYIYRVGAIREMIIRWLLEADKERPHGLKYRLYCGYSDKCLVRHDNQRSKGDRRHYGEHEESYAWVSVQQLMADLKMDIDRLGGEKDE